MVHDIVGFTPCMSLTFVALYMVLLLFGLNSLVYPTVSHSAKIQVLA